MNIKTILIILAILLGVSVGGYFAYSSYKENSYQEQLAKELLKEREEQRKKEAERQRKLDEQIKLLDERIKKRKQNQKNKQ